MTRTSFGLHLISGRRRTSIGMHLLLYTLTFVANVTATTTTTTTTTLPPAKLLLAKRANQTTMNTLLDEASKLTNEIPRLDIWPFDFPDPWELDKIKPKLYIYKKDRPVVEIDYQANMRLAVTDLYAKDYLQTNRLVIITHGFHNDITTPWLTSFKDKILNSTHSHNDDQTVVLVGWGEGANILVIWYRQAAANVITVGDWLGNFTAIVHSFAPKLPIYGIGHSLGAHVVGIAGRNSRAFTRITGLDPAGPCFEKVENSKTLYKTDAHFVDIIHTDGYDSKLDPSEWFFPVNHYGSLIPIGTIDFYPNFGFHQPGAGTFKVAGSHLRALELFEWSIDNPGKFLTNQVLVGVPDFDDPVTKAGFTIHKVEMGYYADKYADLPRNATPLYYIKTNAEVPWV